MRWQHGVYNLAVITLPTCEPYARGFALPSVRKLAHCSVVRTLWVLEAADGERGREADTVRSTDSFFTRIVSHWAD